MMHATDHVLARLLNKLCKLTPLSDEDRAALLALPHQQTSIESGHYIVRDGDKPDSCCVLLTGFAYRSRITAEGGRQILAIHMRGDAVDLQNSMIPIADHSVMTLTQADVAFVPHQAIMELVAKRPKIGEALWRQTLLEGSIAYEWMMNVGRRNARERISHFLCEFALLQKKAGLANGQDYHWPLTQDQLADIAGLTPVHVNRTLQSLRADKLISTKNHVLTIPDFNALREAGGFNSAYLHEEERV